MTKYQNIRTSPIVKAALAEKIHINSIFIVKFLRTFVAFL